MALTTNAGTLKCCNHAPHCLPVSCECCKKFAFVVINVIDFDFDKDYIINSRNRYGENIPVDNKLLHEPLTRDMLSHDPYTPESSCSRSPCPENQDQVDNKEYRRRSVTPEELTKRLEQFLNIAQSHCLKRSTSIDIISHMGPKETFRIRAMSEIPNQLSKSHRTHIISTSSLESTGKINRSEEWFDYEIKTQGKDPVIKEYCDDNTNSTDMTRMEGYNTKVDTINKKSMRSKSCCFIV